jgi:deoxyguanosine kinase
VADFLMDKDRLFAKVALDPAEYALYDQIYSRVTLQGPVPDLVIYLQAPVPVLVRRIERRGIDYEQRIEPDYLERLCAAYVEFFYYYDLAPTLIVNAEETNLADNEVHYRRLLAEIDKGVVGKHYFNPSAVR